MLRLITRIWIIAVMVAILMAACEPASPAPASPTPPPTATTAPSPTPSPTATAVLSPTPAPTSTATAPAAPSPSAPTAARRPAENGIDMVARRLSAPPKLDGDLKDWPGFPCYALDRPEQIGYGDPAVWGGPTDLSGGFCWGWDEEALYLAVDVRDEALRAFTKGNFWENDYIELWIDADLAGDFDKAQNNEDDFQFGFMPGNFADVPARATVFVPGVPPSRLRQIQYSFVRTESGYRGEIKIPFAVFGDALNRSGNRLGAALSFSDCDGDKPAQEMMISTAPKSIAQWGNPTLWNNLDLEP